MKAVFVSMFLLLSSPEYAIVDKVVLNMSDCISARDAIREKFADPDFWAENAMTKYKGQDVVFLGAECLPIFESEEL